MEMTRRINSGSSFLCKVAENASTSNENSKVLFRFDEDKINYFYSLINSNNEKQKRNESSFDREIGEQEKLSSIFGRFNCFSYAKSLYQMTFDSSNVKNKIVLDYVEKILQQLTKNRFVPEEWKDFDIMKEIKETQSSFVSESRFQTLLRLKERNLEVPIFVENVDVIKELKEIRTIQDILDHNALLLRNLEEIQNVKLRNGLKLSNYTLQERGIADEIVYRLQILLKKTTFIKK